MGWVSVFSGSVLELLCPQVDPRNLKIVGFITPKISLLQRDYGRSFSLSACFSFRLNFLLLFLQSHISSYFIDEY